MFAIKTAQIQGSGMRRNRQEALGRRSYLEKRFHEPHNSPLDDRILTAAYLYITRNLCVWCAGNIRNRLEGVNVVGPQYLHGLLRQYR